MMIYERIALAATHVRSRTLVQSFWRRTDAYDREMVCLLAAFGGDINDPSECPVELMPEWLARLLPVMVDGMHGLHFYEFAARFVESAPRWTAFSQGHWSHIRSALLREILWHANAVVEEGDQEVGRVFRDMSKARCRFNNLCRVSTQVFTALFAARGIEASASRARSVFDTEKRLHVGVGGREGRVIMAAQHAARAAFRAADGSVVDAATAMARCASLLDVDRTQHAAWRYTADVLIRLLEKETAQ